MKNLKLLIAVSSLCGAASLLNAEELSISATVGWESEYVFRGAQLADSILTAAVDLEYTGVYVGIWSAQPVNSLDQASQEFDFYGGYAFNATDMLSLDFGLTAYYYPSLEDFAPGADDLTVEAYVGGALDTVLAPALYLYYDFTLENFTIEGSAGHSFDLGNSMSIDLGAYLGYVWIDAGGDYFYGGLNGDLTYSFTDFASASIGPRVSFNDVDVGRDANFWFGASFSAGF